MAGKTTQELLRRKGGERITMVTCYDATFARLVAGAGIDMVLVGDSMGNVIQGHETTLPVTLDEVIYHAKAVARGFAREAPKGKPLPHLTVDLPFMSYQVSPREALRSAGRAMKEVAADSVKLEGGGTESARAVERMVEAGIPVIGHVGLTPQSVRAFGGHKVQGREPDRAAEILDEAHRLESAGAFCLVLEGIPATLAGRITAELRIPTIGIGAGPACDGQVLVLYDLLGLDPDFRPRFLKRYAELHEVVGKALERYAAEVREGRFPDEAHSFSAAVKPEPVKATKK